MQSGPSSDLSDISQVFEVADIFTWMDAISGLKIFLDVFLCGRYYLLQYQLSMWYLRQIWNWFSIWISTTFCVWFPMSYRAEYRFQSALNSHLTWVRIMARYFIVQYESKIPVYIFKDNLWRKVNPDSYFREAGDKIVSPSWCNLWHHSD